MRICQGRGRKTSLEGQMLAISTVLRSQTDRLCEKSIEVSSPRKRGSIPYEHKLDSRRVESSTHFRGNDKTGALVFTQSESLGTR
jgi:hypothetical protein